MKNAPSVLTTVDNKILAKKKQADNRSDVQNIFVVLRGYLGYAVLYTVDLYVRAICNIYGTNELKIRLESNL